MRRFLTTLATAGIIALTSALILSLPSRGQLGMTGFGGGGFGAAAGGGCAEATTYQARVTLGAPYQAAATTLICCLVTAGTWTTYDILYILATNTAATAAVNLPNATYSGTVTNAPTFTAGRGYKPNGGAGYFVTGFNPSGGSPNFTVNNGQAEIWNLTTGTDANYALGLSDGSPGSAIYPKYSDNNIYARINEVSSGGHAIGTPTGLLKGNRTASNAEETFQNASSLGTDSTASIGTGSATISVVGNALQESIREIAIVAMGSSHSGTQTTNEYNCMQAYATTIGF